MTLQVPGEPGPSALIVNAMEVSDVSDLPESPNVERWSNRERKTTAKSFIALRVAPKLQLVKEEWVEARKQVAKAVR